MGGTVSLKKSIGLFVQAVSSSGIVSAWGLMGREIEPGQGIGWQLKNGLV
jgi:hypothetical protein